MKCCLYRCWNKETILKVIYPLKMWFNIIIISRNNNVEWKLFSILNEILLKPSLRFICSILFLPIKNCRLIRLFLLSWSLSKKCYFKRNIRVVVGINDPFVPVNHTRILSAFLSRNCCTLGFLSMSDKDELVYFSIRRK